MTDVRLRLRAADANEPGAVPFVDFVFARVGARRGARLLAFIQAWAVVADELARTPTAEEYAARFKLPVATAYRDQALFREAFRDETPEDVLVVIWDAIQGRSPRHVLSAPVIRDLDAPDDASLAVAWFVATLVDRLPAGASDHVDRAVPPLVGSAASRRTEVARAYRLAELAVFSWAAAALAQSGEDAHAAGLASLERFRPFDAGAASYAAAILREYLDRLAEEARPSTVAAASAAEAAAELGTRMRPGDARHYADVGRSAATALQRAFATAAVLDVVTPTRETVAELVGDGAAEMGSEETR